MSQRKSIYFILLFLFIITLVLKGIIWHSKSQKLSVNFLDVGQGDAILISQGSKQVLIDGGPDGQKLLEKLGKYIPFWDREIEVMIATHPDQDHIDGLIDAMKNYKIGEVIDNGVESDSQLYKKFKEMISEKNINELEGKKGMEIDLGNGAKLEILSPDGMQEKENPKDTNVSSIISKLTYGENSFLLTGDMTMEGEEKLILETSQQKSAITARFLKVGHHGSKYSTSEEFLKAVVPQEAIISVGKNNRYGHPSSEALERLEAYKVNVRRTDEGGDIEYEF